MAAADLLLRSVTRLIRPLIRLLIQSGVGFPVLADTLRGLYVDVAHSMLRPDQRTDSRIHLLTGVHRKEIRRLRLEASAQSDIPLVVSIGSLIVARWIGSAETTDAATGKPKPLPRAVTGEGPCFDNLVRSVTTDIRPRTVLDDWIAQGVATLDAQDRVVLNETAFVPHQNEEAQLYYFGRNLHDHMAAASENVAAVGRPNFLDRSVHYNHLSHEAASALEKTAREAAQQLLVDLNRIALSLADNDKPEGPTRRVNLGVYLYSADDEEAGA